ncbi:MAG: hypothetical protein WAU81_08640 [Candidatus Aminicenantales bacterium]
MTEEKAAGSIHHELGRKEGDIFSLGQLDSLLIRFLASHIDNGFGADYVGCPDRLGIRQAGEKKDSRLAKSKNITHQVGSSSRCDFFIDTVMASYDLSLKEFFDFF